MKLHHCKICYSSFKTKEGLLSHESKKVNETNFNGLILKNNNKYFIFSKNDYVTRKHEEIYFISQIYKRCVDGKVKGNVLKESSFEFTTGELEKKIKSESLVQLEELELNNLSEYLDELNSERIYYYNEIENYYSKI